MIVKDEEANLPRCLDSIKGFADEIVICDTGSTDRTIEIARGYTDKIFIDPWREDFSYHRNKVMKAATKPWLMIIDADEKLVIRDGMFFKRFLGGLEDDFTAVAVPLHDIRGGQIKMSFSSGRFFRNGTVKYMNTVHNKPVIKGQATASDAVVINHYGYDLTPEQYAKKQRRLEAMLSKFVREHPDDPDIYMYLSQFSSVEQEPLRSIKHAEKYLSMRAIDNPQFNAGVLYTLIKSYMTLQNEEQARDLLNHYIDAGDFLDLAFAGIEFGLQFNDPVMIEICGRRYISIFQKFMENPALQGPHFYYHLRAESLAVAHYHMGLARLQGGSFSLMKVMELFDRLPHSTQEHILNAMQADLGGLKLNELTQKIRDARAKVLPVQ